MSPCFECRCCCCQPHRPTASPLMIYFLTLLRTSDVLFRPFPCCSSKHCQTGAPPMIYYNVRRNCGKHPKLTTLSTQQEYNPHLCPGYGQIFYITTKLMVSLTSLAPPHLSYLPQVGEEKVSEAVESNFNQKHFPKSGVSLADKLL